MAGAEGEGGGSHSSREARNLAEKHRRDKQNAYIQELASMVPHVADSTRRLDKTGILRCAAHGLRVQYIFGKSVWRKQKVSKICDDPDFANALTHILDSFFVAITAHGQIVVISSTVEKILGHCQTDLYGQNILSITHPDDHAAMLENLIPRDMEALFRNSNEYNMQQTSPNNDEQANFNTTSRQTTEPFFRDSAGNNNNNTTQNDAYLNDIDERLRNDKRTFLVRLARAGTRSEANRKYELMRFDGCYRRSDFSCSSGTFPIVSQLIRRTRNNGNGTNGGVHMLQHDVIAQAARHGISGNDVVFVAMARIIRTPKIANVLFCESTNGRLEYKTRHLIDGRIIDCDQRIGLVAGYMKDEVYNLSPFTFIHEEDVRWVIIALRRMYDNNMAHGESFYRLVTRNGNYIYLHSKGYYDYVGGKRDIYSFVCVNTLLSEEEGRYYIDMMKKSFSTIVQNKIADTTSATSDTCSTPERDYALDVPACSNAEQLERIVLYLVDNLQTRHNNRNGTGCGEDTGTQADNERTGTPLLSLVAPEPASVKTTIAISVAVVKTATKNRHLNMRNMRRQFELQSPSSVYSNSDVTMSPCSYSSDDGHDAIGSPLNMHPSTSAAAAAAASRAAAEAASTSASATVNVQRPSVLQLNTQAVTSRQAATLVELPQHIAQTPVTPQGTSSVLEQRLTAPTTATNATNRLAYASNGESDSLHQQQQQEQQLRPQQQQQQRHTTVLKRLRTTATLNGNTSNNNSACTSNGYASDSSGITTNNNKRHFGRTNIEELDISPTKRRQPSSSSSLPPSDIQTLTTATLLAQPVQMQDAISHSLQNIDQSLQSIEENARNLCQQHAQLLPQSVPSAFNQQLEYIFNEHQRQAEQLLHIRNEYDVHMQEHQQQQQQPHQQPQLPALQDGIYEPFLPLSLPPQELDAAPSVDTALLDSTLPVASSYLEPNVAMLNELEKQL
uniref:Circadian locomoter output cycles protein kaput n=1 Tax=Ceratitis capitata TaxID=7213 RepID=W8B7X8_CERCA